MTSLGMLAWAATLSSASAWAAPYRAGHHHAEFDWYTIETRFFRIHYPVSDGKRPVDTSRTAAELARVADRLLLELSALTEQVPRGPIHVVVSDEADGMTAYTLPHWRWIVLSADPGVEVLRLRGRPEPDWVTDALAHELGHVLGHRQAMALAPSSSYGLEGAGTVELGRLGAGMSVVLGPSEPYGWSEGAAEAWSGAIGVARWSAGRAATLHTSALAGRLLDWDEFLVSVDKGDLLDAERAYQQGWAFARWLQDRYQRDVFLEVGQSAGRLPPWSWSRRFEERTGVPARILWAQWRASAQADAVARQARREALGLAEGRELERWSGAWRSTDLATRDRFMLRSQRDREEARESTGSFELFPRTSPDGRWIAEGKVGWLHVWRGDPRDWPSEGDRSAQRDARSAETSVWLPATFGVPPAFVPGRDALVVSAPEDVRRPPWAPAPRDANSQLYLVDLTPEARALPHRGGTISEETLRWSHRQTRQRMQPIPNTWRARDPAVSPDGQWLAFLAYSDGATDLAICRLDGSELRRLSSFEGGEWLQHPSWSPDGRSLVVSRLSGDRPDLWTVDVASGQWTRLTDDPGVELDAVWASDGIWFTEEVDGVREVLRLDLAQGRVLQQTRTTGGAHTPWVLPGGDLLYSAYTAYGWKAMRLPAAEQLSQPLPREDDLETEAHEAMTPAQLPEVPIPAARPYRSLRSGLAPGVSPLLRLDAPAVRTGPPVRPLAGAFVRWRDAIERWDLYGYGLAGEDMDGSTRLAWRGLPPELALFAAGSVDSRVDGRVSAGTVGLALSQRVRDGVELGVSAERWATSDALGPRVQSLRASARLEVGEARSREDESSARVRLEATHAWSATQWNRLMLDVSGVTPLPWATGPLFDHRLRIEWDLLGGLTDRPVSPDERLYVGGDVPGALRMGLGPVSVPLPGFAPYATGSETLAVAKTTWLAPVAPRIRTALGPLYLQSLDLGAGLGVAATPEAALGSGTLEARLTALLFDTPWDGVLRAAWGVGAELSGDPLSHEPTLRETSQMPTAGPRLLLGLGTGF